MNKQHLFKRTIEWTGNNGTGTSDYKAYERHHTIRVEGKPDIHASSDPAFRGDGSKYNPEDFLLASLSSCHMLWYLHLCAVAGVIVTDYTDHATGVMEEVAGGGGQFTSVTLHPIVIVTEASMIAKAIELHKKAGELCFIARSVNFPVDYKPVAKTQ